MKKSKFIPAVSILLIIFLIIPVTVSVFAEADISEVIVADADWPKRSDGTMPAGTAGDPYLIEDAADLLAFNSKRTDSNVGNNNYKGKYIILTNDIDLNPGWDAKTLTAPANVWNVFYNFSGVLDGKGHTIKGIYSTGTTYVGFIRNGTDCTVKNIKIDNSAIIASGNVCGFIATLQGTSTLDGIVLESGSTVKGKSSVGGLVGNAYNGTEHTIINCKFNGNVICSENYAGGLIGDTYQGTQFTLKNCYCGGNIVAQGLYAGGIAGNISKSSTLINCAFGGSVTSSDFAGGLVGRNAALLNIEDCISYGNVNSSANASGILGLCAGKAVLDKCISVSTLSSENNSTAEFLTEYKTSDSYVEADKTLTDCYSLSEYGVHFYDGNGSVIPSKLNIIYSGEPTAEFTKLEAKDQLPENTAFSASDDGYYGWTVYEGTVMPATVKDLLTQHTFTSTYYNATCLDYDHTDYLCTTCGYSYTEWGYEKSEHVCEQGWTYDPAPTETVGGKRYKVCDVCHTVYDVEYVPIEGATYNIISDWGKDSTTLYKISSAAELMSFAAKRATYSNYKDARVILTADIDLNPGWDASSGLRPTNVLTYMFEFDGIFDGQGHTISGLYFEGNPQNNMTYACFINKLSNATVKNLKIANSHFSTQSNYAGLFGTVQGNVTIENVFADITVESAKYAGGILTQVNADSTVILKNVVFAGSVTASQFAGGILGWDNKQTVSMTNCANYGSVNVTADTCGGLIGQVSGNVTLVNCFASGSVTTGSSKNGVITYANNPQSLTLTDCYIDSALSSLSAVAGNSGSAYTIKYGEENAEQIRSVSDLAALNEQFSGWIISNDGKYSVPESLFCYVNGHDLDCVITPPTCFSLGFTTGTCRHCGNKYIMDYVDMIEHTPSDEWIIDSPATESRMGSKHLECAVCGEVLDQAIIPKLKSENENTEAVTTTQEVSDTVTETPGKSKGCSSSLFRPAFILPLLAVTSAAVMYKRQKKLSK